MSRRIELVGEEDRRVWAGFATAALAKIVTPVETEEQKNGEDVIGLTVMPPPDGPGGAADIAASYADAMMAEYQRRDKSRP